MIGHKSPGITSGLGPGTKILKSFNKVVTILIVAEYLPAFYPPDHNMVQNAGSIYLAVLGISWLYSQSRIMSIKLLKSVPLSLSFDTKAV